MSMLRDLLEKLRAYTPGVFAELPRPAIEALRAGASEFAARLFQQPDVLLLGSPTTCWASCNR